MVNSILVAILGSTLIPAIVTLLANALQQHGSERRANELHELEMEHKKLKNIELVSKIIRDMSIE